MSHETETPPARNRRWLCAGIALGLVAALALAACLKREPVRLSLVTCTNAVTGLRTAFLCLTNDSPERITILSDGGTRPYYHLIEYLTLSTNPVTMLVTNYNQDAFFHVTPGSLAPHAGVVFPVEIPGTASNTTIIVSYMPPDNVFHDLVEQTQILLGRRAARPSRTYNNLSLKPPIN